MPNYVAIEIDKDKLLVACAKSAGRRFQIHQLFEIDIAADELPKSIGDKLKTELSDRGVSRAEGLGIVCRQDAEMREVSVPPAPDNELPDLVRFQAKNVFASLNDNWLFDFVPFEHLEGKQQRVLAFAISPDVNNRMQAITEAAGLKLKRMLFRPYSLCELFDDYAANDASQLTIIPVGNRFDIIINDGKKMIAARSFQAQHDQEAAILVNQVVNECKRTIASTRASLNSPLKHIVIGGTADDWAALEAELKNKLDIDVKYSNPLGGFDATNLTAANIPETPERFSSLLGALAGEYSNAKPTVDFLNPRRPVVKKRDPKKILIPVAGFAFIALVGFGYCWYLLNQQQRQISAKDDELRQIRNQNAGDKNRDIPGVDQIIAEVGKLDDWQSKKVNWLEELAWISEKMLTADDIIISRFRGSEDPEGFKISLNARTTKEISADTSWKKMFSERYVNPVFHDSTTDSSNPDLPVVRPFTLYGHSDLDATVESVSNLAFENQEKELEMLDGPDLENGEEEEVLEN